MLRLTEAVITYVGDVREILLIDAPR